MNLLQAKALEKFRHDLTDILLRCTSRDQIVTHFSSYLLGQMVQQHIEDYDFFPEFTPTETIVKVHVFFVWDITARHEIIVKKNDNPQTAYNRAMGVI